MATRVMIMAIASVMTTAVIATGMITAMTAGGTRMTVGTPMDGVIVIAARMVGAVVIATGNGNG